MAAMDNTIVSVILFQLQNVFHADLPTITWVITAYFLGEAVVIPIVGYLSDYFGSKTVFQISLTLFTGASLLCALSPTVEALIAFRALQGIGGGALIPMLYTINYRIFPPNERSKLTAVVSIPILLAPAFAPVIGGYLSAIFNWSAVFLINVPIGIITILLSFLILPGRESDGSGGAQQAKGERKHFDFLGMALSTIGIAALVYGISEAGSQSWGEATVLIPLLLGIVILIVFTVVELRVSDPVLDLRLFKNIAFTITNSLLWFVVSVTIGAAFILPLFFESVQGDSPLVAGSFLISSILAIGVGMSVSGVLYNRMGPRTLTLFGLLLLTVGTYGFTQIDVNTTGGSLQIWMIVRSFGVGFVYQPMQTFALSVVSNKAMARASSLVTVARQVTTAAATAILGTYLTQQTATHVADINNALQVGLQTHNLTGVAATCAQTASPTLNPTLLNTCVGQHATAAGVADTFWLLLVVGVACFPLALFIRRRSATEALKPAKSSAGEKHLAAIPNVISTLTVSGQKETMWPEILLWRYPEDKVTIGSLLTVENNQFCILKSFGTILNVYETGQHTMQTPDLPHFGSIQLAFSGVPIPWQYEVLYINRTKLLVNASGVALSHDMVEVNYSVDYYIHIATPEDAIRLVEHMPHLSHALTIQEINTYVGPIIEEAMNQLLLITPLAQLQGLQIIQDLSLLVNQHLRPFLSTYGITLDMVKVRGLSPRDERMKGLILLKAFGLNELDAVRHYAVMQKNAIEQHIIGKKDEIEQNLYMIWSKTLERYTNEIVALQSELENTRVTSGLLTDTHNTPLQELSQTIRSDLRSSLQVLDENALPDPQVVGRTGQFKGVASASPKSKPY
jgi:EmrB/QacA subfamily drug resistance transporter